MGVVLRHENVARVQILQMIKGELRLRASVVENVNAGLHDVLRVCAWERVDYDGKRNRHSAKLNENKITNIYDSQIAKCLCKSTPKV